METNPLILLPKPQTLFQQRADRFRQLAQTQVSLAGYLQLMAGLADTQHRLVGSFPHSPMPDSAGSTPPLAVSTWPRDPAWRAALRTIADRINPGADPLAALCGRILAAADADIETWAEGLLAGELASLDPGIAPFVAAALQTYWTDLAGRLDAGQIKLPEAASDCPVCGALPVASVLQTGGVVQGLRYLCCGWCATQWNRPRIQCIHCGSSREVAYVGVAGAGEMVKAEVCDACKTYVKQMNRETAPGLDPCADDLASLALDLALAEAGYNRLGFNPLLIPGANVRQS